MIVYKCDKCGKVFEWYETCFNNKEFNEETAADRIGRRIRAIRIEKGMSQAELGAAMGLTADRIQKYENSARKPKFDQGYRTAMKESFLRSRRQSNGIFFRNERRKKKTKT